MNLLLDERTEVLTLVTNSLKNDLHHESQYVIGLALTSVGNLATVRLASFSGLFLANWPICSAISG